MAKDSLRKRIKTLDTIDRRVRMDLSVQSLNRAREIMALVERMKGFEFTPEEARVLMLEIQSRTRV